ncbi:LacI family DNA-binding transcriptional regulator [Arsenicicoccus piscis]|uniref:LacI family DNA-binding transcriptional regulator n=1 Tax=Arsenicicoccus piscis TaxID=673954 RepID=UPI001F4CBD3B|nr:LacI family DNA-binding transcriptional regulator [Arsenicicoccus piscis]MCH8627047.1 LacI family DNA-binding transcriptional regulator [Arsenicicoccus piscis]
MSRTDAPRSPRRGRATSTQATLRDVADAAGVSVTTASVALNDVRAGVRVSEPTRRRVREVAKRLEYRPNSVARSLRTQSTQTIGFISDEVTTTPFAVSMLAAAQAEAARHDQLLFVLNVGVDATPAMQRRAVDALVEHRVSGIIYACMHHREIDAPDFLPQRTVFLNARDVTGRHRSIVPDDEQGGRLAATALVEAGHERIGYLDDSAGNVAAPLRRKGFQDVLRESGLGRSASWERSATPDVSGGRDTELFFDLPIDQRPTGLFCFNDRMAMGAYQRLRRLGLHVPDDLSIVGFDDQEFIAAELDPPLTTVRLPLAEMGARAVQQVLDADPATPDEQTVRVPCTLVRRASVGAPPAVLEQG